MKMQRVPHRNKNYKRCKEMPLMPWIESHQELGRHPKTKRFARLMSISLPAAIGHLHYLWWWSLDYAQDGDLSRYTPGDIAEASYWEGDSDELLNALIEAGFVDRNEGLICIHDWDVYGGKLLQQKVSSRERMKKWRTESRSQKRDPGISHGYDGDVKAPDAERYGDVTRNERVTNANVTRNERVPYANVTQLEESTVENITGEDITGEKRTGQKKETAVFTAVKKKAPVFVVPTIFEVGEYCAERKNDIDPERFVDHYESIGWVYGKAKTPMTDWKAAVRVWERNQRTSDNTPQYKHRNGTTHPDGGIWYEDRQLLGVPEYGYDSS
jgi:hypothetical protein